MYLGSLLLCFILSFDLQVSALSVALPKSVLLSLSSKYSGCLKSHPLLTNVLTASTLCVLSDSISQHFERSKAKADSLILTTKTGETQRILGHSWYRSFCMAAYGATIYGWLVIYWFRFLNNLIPQEGITRALIVKKVFINQLVMSPFLNSLFFTYVCATRDLTSTLSQKFQQIKQKLSKDLLPTIKRSCVYWGFVQYINFSYVATAYQLLYTNSAFLIWTTYIAYVGFRKVE